METGLQGLGGLSQSHAKPVIGIANTEGVRTWVGKAFPDIEHFRREQVY